MPILAKVGFTQKPAIARTRDAKRKRDSAQPQEWTQSRAAGARRSFIIVAVAIAVAQFAMPAPAQLLSQNPISAAENFDIRTDQAGSSNVYMERFAARRSFPGVAAFANRRAEGVARLRANLAIDLIDSPEMGTTEVVSARLGTGFLTAPATDRVAAMRAFLSAYADVYGLTLAQIANLDVVVNYENPAGNMAWVELEQRINGLPVFRGVIRGGFTARGELVRTTGQLASGLDARSLPVLPALPASAAVSRAAQSVGWDVPVSAVRQKTSVGGRLTFDRGPMADDAKAWLTYFPLAPGVARLAWSIEIWGDPDAFLVLLDAEDGTLLFRKNLTEQHSEKASTGTWSRTLRPGGETRTYTFTVGGELGTAGVYPLKPAPPQPFTAEAAFVLAQQQEVPTVSTGTTTAAFPVVANGSGPTLDFVARRAYLRSASGSGGTVLEIPTVGQSVYFNVDLQIYGTGNPVVLTARARIDGAQHCTIGGTVSPGQTLFGFCGSPWAATPGTHTLEWDLDYNGTVVETDETNNSASKTFTPSTATFDFVAQRSYMRLAPGPAGVDLLDQPAIGETVYFHLNWQVTGTGGSTVSVRAVLDGTTFCTLSALVTPPVSVISWCPSGWVVTAGSHTLEWDLDYDTLLTEQDELNNSAAKTFNPSATQGTQPATYHVYLDDSPAPLSPTTVLPGSGTQAPYIARTARTLIGNEAPNQFNDLGWMKDGANVTDGNNAEAGVDLDFIDGVDAPVTGVGRVFNFSYNPETDNPATAAYRNGEVTDMFYWTNVYHDELHRLGFTEASANFQNDNFGRGGVGGDRVRAEAQDFNGLTNANFSTPTDGGRGRMQMYIFSGPNPDRTSGLDHDVLLHELTHGTSNRLHSNAVGLDTTMSRGMGEGWSDFYALALLSKPSDDPNAIYSTGGWVTHMLVAGYTDNYYYGIRRFPYAVRSNVGSNGKPHNPLTLADIDSAQINLTDGAYPRGPVGSSLAFQVHNIGEVWASALWEARARFINRLGWANGNDRFLQFVTDGMKLDPVNPTPLQGRDSILAAASAGVGTPADINDIWAGFADRGMGMSAQVVNANNGTVVEAFDVPDLAPKRRRGQLVSD